MARPRPLLYQVRQVKTPYHGKSWKVTAYIGGKRKQHWFASEREAKTFADDSNAELYAYGSQLSDLSLALANSRKQSTSSSRVLASRQVQQQILS
jgi:hypothetical protein